MWKQNWVEQLFSIRIIKLPKINRLHQRIITVALIFSNSKWLHISKQFTLNSYLPHMLIICHHYCHQTAHPADPSRSKSIKKALKNCSTATLLLSRSLHAVLWITNDSFRIRNQMQIEFSKFWMRIWIQVKVRIHVDPDPGKSSHPCRSGSG